MNRLRHETKESSVDENNDGERFIHKAMQLSMTKAKGHNKKWLLAYANEIKESGLLCAL